MELEESYEAGAITKEEYEKKKKEIEALPDDPVPKKTEEKEEKVSLKSDRTLIVILVLVAILIGGFFSIQHFNKEEDVVLTLDDLHQMNLDGELDSEVGYLYNDVYSFVKQDNVWYTKLLSQTGNTEFGFNFRYGPREVENFSLVGELDTDLFDNATEYFVTFNPLGKDFTQLQAARFDFDTQMIKIFRKVPKSACDRNASNQTSACDTVPIVTCDSTDEIVMYYVESDDAGVEYRDNCIIVSGREFDFVKGVDRILFDFYDIMQR